MPGRSASEQAESVRPGLAVGQGGAPRPAPVAVALDAPDLDTAAHWAALVTPYVSTVKIGLELYLRYGPDVVATVRGASGVNVFLDLKLHDIPNTVAGAARAVSRLRPEILTVHAAGGADMIKAAVEAVPGTMVAGVTLLTSIRDHDLAELGRAGHGQRRRPPDGGARRRRGRPRPRLLAAGGRRRPRRGRPGHHPHHPGHPPVRARTATTRPASRPRSRRSRPARTCSSSGAPSPGPPTRARPPPRSPRRCAGPPRPR